MRIQFDNCNFQSKTGPNTFGLRLAKELYNQGHEVVFEHNQVDISLVFIEPTGAQLSKKVVQRLDGIWSKPIDFESKNKQIKRLYDSSDAVVFQSSFDKKFIENVWGKSKHHAVIHNGVKINPISSFSSPELEKIRQQYDYVFVSSANWHPQKRLKANTELFMHLKTLLDKKCCYLVLGENPDYVISDKDVFYAGSVPERLYMEIYAMANWMIHLAWRDHCPNTNIECLSQNTPIICSEDSGSAEIIGNHGVVLKEQIENDLKLFNYDEPPLIDVTQLTELKNINVKSVPDVSIERCANQYIELFKQLLES